MLQRRSRKLAPWHSSVGLSCSGLGPCILKPEAYEGRSHLSAGASREARLVLLLLVTGALLKLLS